MTFFSIIIPTYNRAGFLRKSVESVLNQEFRDWELIIVDDGSTDDTKAVVNEYCKKDNRIKYFYQQNSERSVARNNGIKKAVGTYICFLDSDDYYDENYLELLYKEIIAKKKPVAVFSTGYKTLSENEIIYRDWLPTGNILVALITTFSVVPVRQCVHNYILEEFSFDQRFTLWEDTHLFFKILSKYKCYSVKKYPINVLSHANSTVSQVLYKVNKRDINRYLEAIDDLKLFFNNEYYSKLLNRYKVEKIKMFVYQARLNKQYGLVNSLLLRYFLSVKSLRYFIITIIKNNISLIFRIKIP